MNNFTKSCGRAYWHSIANCSPSFGSLQSKSLKAVLLLMFFTLSSGALFAQDIDGCMHEPLPGEAAAAATIDTTGCDQLNELHAIPSKGNFMHQGDSFPWGEASDDSDSQLGATGFDKTSTHCDWTFYYVFDLKCNNDIKRITVSYHGGDDTAPYLKDKKKHPFPADQKGLDLCYNDRPTAPSAQDIADLYTDNCDHVKASDMVSKRTRVKNDDCGWIEIHTYTIKDYCDSNAFEMSLTFSGSDQSVPEFDNLPMDLVGEYAVQCDNIPPAQKLNWSDNCTSPGKAVAEEDDNNFDCSGGYILRTWNIEDACGNKNSHTQKIDILPANPVKFEETSLHVYVPCDDRADAADYFPAELGYSNAHDKIDYNDPPNNDYDYHCLVSGSVKAEYTLIEESCGTFTVTYSYDDECNSIVKTVTVHIVDEENPKILKASDKLIVECDGAGNLDEYQAWLDSYGGADASDNCDTDLTWTNDAGTISNECGETGRIFVVFTVSDDCGNESKTGNWFIIRDSRNPDMTQAFDERVVCDGAGNTEQYERWIKENGGATAKDDCSDVTWSNDGPVLQEYIGEDGKKHKEDLSYYIDNGCSKYTGWVKVTFRATDDCGNYSESSAIFSIEDSIAPVINTQAKNETVECDGTLPLFNLGLDMADVESQDETQFHGTNFGRLILWLRNHGYAGDVDEDCSNVSWSKEIIDAELNGCYSYLTVRFTASDDCGNSSSTTATFRVEDTMSPVLTEEAHDKDVECVDKDVEQVDEDGVYRNEFRRWLWRHGYSKAWDKCDRRLTWTNDWNGKSFSDECGETGAVTVMFTVTDNCGLSSSTSAEFRIRDTKAPYLEQLPDLRFDLDEKCMRDINPETIDSYPDSYDECGNVDVRWEDTAKQGEACKNFVERTWTATDDCGNVTTRYQTIYLEDNSAPVLTGSVTQFNLTNYDACEAPAPPTLAQIAAQFDDNCYEPIVTLVNTNVSRDDICGWTTIFEYDVRDRCDNVYNGTVKVIYFGSDQTAPVLDGTKPKGESGLNMCYTDAVAAYPGANALDVAGEFKDECDTAKLRVVKTFVPNTNLDKDPTGCDWSFHYNFKVYDICGNYYEFNEYYSGQDKLAPRLNDGVDLNALSISGWDSCKDEAPEGPSMQDIADLFTECGDDTLGQEIFVERNKYDIGQDNDCNWQFLYEYTVSDKCGNAYPTFKVLISGSDQTAPEWNVQGGAEGTFYTSVWTDYPCPANITPFLSVGDVITPGGLNYLIYANNSFTVGVFRINLGAQATDDCTANEDLRMRVTNVDNNLGDCQTVLSITFELLDDCNNNGGEIVCVWTFVDDTAPTASNPADIVVQCADDVPAPDTEVVIDEADNCNDVTVTFVDDESNFITSDKNLIVNGGFESGDETGWTFIGESNNPGPGGCDQSWIVATSGSTCLSVDNPSEGTYASYSSFDGNGPQQFIMKQAVAVPGNVTVANLSWLETFNHSFGGMDRTFIVEKLDVDTNTLTTLLSETYSGNGNSNGWLPRDVDLLSCFAGNAGNTLIISFVLDIPQHFTGPAGFGIDDVQLNVTMANIEIITRTYKVEDACGNSINVEQSIKVEDTIAPEIECSGDIAVDAMAPAKAGFTTLGVYNGKAYYVSNAAMTGANAHADALLNGGFAVTINDASEDAWVKAAAFGKIGDIPYWIGLTDAAVEGTFVWQDGDPSAYRNWDGGEPNSNGDEDYVEGNSPFSASSNWNDEKAASTRQYVLEVNAGAVVNYAAPIFSDNCDANPHVSFTHESGDVFPVGESIVTITVTDASGNDATCTFMVTVNNPAVQLPPAAAPTSSPKVEDEVTLNFKAYPVPFNKEVSLAYNFDFDTDVTIEVYDTKGLLVKRVENRGYKSGSDATIPMSIQGADQLYYVKLITNRGTVTKKIVSSQVNHR